MHRSPSSQSSSSASPQASAALATHAGEGRGPEEPDATRANATPWGLAHPWFLALLPVLWVYGPNRGLIALPSLLLSLGASFALAALALVLARLVLGRWQRGAVGASLLLVLLHSYGHLYRFAFGNKVRSVHIEEQAQLLGLWTLTLLMLWLLLRRWPRRVGPLNNLLSVVSAALLLQPLALALGVVGPATQHGTERRPDPTSQPGTTGTGQSTPQATDPTIATPGPLPDIYLIIPDGFGRADLLADRYGLDSESFLLGLRELGFTVGRHSIANYAQTHQSVASCLNLDYLQDLPPIKHLIGSDSGDRVPMLRLIQHSRAVERLRQAGYRTVAFASGYQATEMRSADLYLESDWASNELLDALLVKTPVPTLSKLLLGYDQRDWHRGRVLHALQGLSKVAGSSTQPLFVLAHILGPHPPFVFRADGSPTGEGKPFSLQDGSHFLRSGTREEYRAGYSEQVRFMQRRLLQTLRAILAASKRPPVILLQADHGPGLGLHYEDLERTDLEERYSILQAWTLPEPAGRAANGETTTEWETGTSGALRSPVNALRLVFRTYLGDTLERLPDRAFYSSWEHPYRLTEVTARLQPSAVETP